ncbi:unnamed protein product [Phytophthora lilii]|uniref:Unnamed protein product n=1 Tax=Phytophthora lilii TaxID=2077276 RepID=A0A9W6WRY0_9STRA|nr:unnamed protein product [Phytophthora lilii]
MEEAVARINAQRPRLVFLTSKSGAGKTYFLNQLEGYAVLELDELVKALGKDFGMEEPAAFKVYKNTLAEPVTAAFVERIHDFFRQNDDKPIVVEGAIADAELVRRVFSGPYEEFTFVYLYPVDIDAYVARMMTRFEEDKKNNTRSLAIWPQVTPELEMAALDSPDLKEFMVGMARWSISKSDQRYDHFKKNGFDMILCDLPNALAEPVMTAFIERVHGFFWRNASKSVVLEGAIADADLVKKVFSGPFAEFMFVYLYPVDVGAYAARMMKRFQFEKEKQSSRPVDLARGDSRAGASRLPVCRAEEVHVEDGPGFDCQVCGALRIF